MGDLFLVILAIILIAEGKGSVILWAAGGFLALAVIARITEKAKERKAEKYFSGRPVNRTYSEPAVRRMASVYAEDEGEEERKPSHMTGSKRETSKRAR